MILKLIFKWSWFNFVSKIQKLWIWRSWKVSAELPWQTIFLFSQSHHRINKKNYFYMRMQCQEDTVVGTSDIQEISLCSWCSKPIWQKYLWISNFLGSYEKKIHLLKMREIFFNVSSTRGLRSNLCPVQWTYYEKSNVLTAPSTWTFHRYSAL